uniref:Uncharacterized protein n=1 Tax=Peromyscus maniculatus bairdii TaxID=230844 RepID=A0A8C8UK08_PERMB
MWKDRQTLQCLISVLLAFLASASLSPGKPKYMVLVPSQLYTETPEKICFHLYDLNETVTVRAFLQSSWGTRSLSNEFVVDKDMFHCDSFTLPRVSASDEKVSLSVHIKGPTHEFNKKSMVLVKNKESVVFVQTDKPVYKPGQSGTKVHHGLWSQEAIMNMAQRRPGSLDLTRKFSLSLFLQSSFGLSLWIKTYAP